MVASQGQVSAGRALAYDAETGKFLWQDAIGRAMGGGVTSYNAGSRQHVAVLAGLNSPIWPVQGGRALLAVYSLP